MKTFKVFWYTELFAPEDDVDPTEQEYVNMTEDESVKLATFMRDVGMDYSIAEVPSTVGTLTVDELLTKYNFEKYI